MTGTGILRFDGDVVRLSVRERTRPALCLESGPPWTRLSLEGRSLGWARPAPGWQTLVWIGEGHPGSLEVIPPLRASECAPRSWPGFFARALLASKRAPLAASEWELSELRASSAMARDELAPIEASHRAPYRAIGALEAISAEPHRVLRWVSPMAPNVVALRAPSRPDAARVRAWRKHARAGTLPPALLLWISTMGGYAILDGHDRLQAASLEHVRPSAVALYAFRDAPHDVRWMASAERAYERAFAHERLKLPTAIAQNHVLTESHTRPRSHASIARYVPDLAARFDAEHPEGEGLSAEIRGILRRPSAR